MPLDPYHPPQSPSCYLEVRTRRRNNPGNSWVYTDSDVIWPLGHTAPGSWRLSGCVSFEKATETPFLLVIFVLCRNCRVFKSLRGVWVKSTPSVVSESIPRSASRISSMDATGRFPRSYCAISSPRLTRRLRKMTRYFACSWPGLCSRIWRGSYTIQSSWILSAISRASTRRWSSAWS